MEIEVSEIALSGGMSPVGGEEIPFGGFEFIDLDAFALVAHVSETVLGFEITLVGGLLVPFDCLDLVGAHSDPIAFEVAVGVLRIGEACVCGR